MASGALQTVRQGRTVRLVRRQGESQACRRCRAFRSLRSLRIHHFRASLPGLDARRKDPFPEVHYGTLSKMPGGLHAGPQRRVPQSLGGTGASPRPDGPEAGTGGVRSYRGLLAKAARRASADAALLFIRQSVSLLKLNQRTAVTSPWAAR